MSDEGSVQKVADDVYLLTEAEGDEGWFISLIVCLGQEIGLMDTGYAQTPAGALFPFLKTQGRTPAEITMVVNTHRDRDHVQGNAAVRQRSSARFAMHELDAGTSEPPDLFVADGDQIDLGGRRFEVIHAPGHRPGNICLYDRSARLLLTGDTVMGTRRDLIRMAPEVQLRSLKRLEELDFERMVMAHPFEPIGKAILDRAEAHEMLQSSIEIVEGMPRRPA